MAPDDHSDEEERDGEEGTERPPQPGLAEPHLWRRGEYRIGSRAIGAVS
jgi:hypothetical protein